MPQVDNKELNDLTLYVSEPEAVVGFIDGLKKSAGYAHSLAHYQQNSNWLKIRDMLENTIVLGQTLAVSKAMPRQTLLEEMNKRQNAIRTE